MAENHSLAVEFKVTSVEVDRTKVKPQQAWQVIVKLTNAHGVGIGGKVYATVGALETLSQLVGVLPGQTTTFDFRHSAGPITRIYTHELLCTHNNPQHVYSFEIKNPTNGATYGGTAS